MNEFSRTELLLGRDAMERLANAHVAVFGIGGVGGYVVEALARSGVGALDLIDNDDVSLTNINRQIIATHKTMGRKKTQVMRDRVLDINPQARVVEHPCFFLPENADSFPFDEYDYVVDAVDTVAAKLELAQRCERLGVPHISAMGAGNKLDPCAFKVADIYGTHGCPLARVMRKELRKRGVKSLKVVYSEEAPLKPGKGGPAGPAECASDECRPKGEAPDGEAVGVSAEAVARKVTPGSVAFVPSVAGLIVASEVVKDLVAPRRAGA